MNSNQYTQHCEQHSNGNKYWCLNGLLHRTNGPAAEHFNGDKYWYQHNKLHRENGPAIEYPNGTKMWYQLGKRHRMDGPAIIYTNHKEWYIHGKQYTEQEFKTKMESTGFERELFTI